MSMFLLDGFDFSFDNQQECFVEDIFGLENIPKCLLSDILQVEKFEIMKIKMQAITLNR